LNHSRPRFGCRAGTFNPSCRQILSTRFLRKLSLLKLAEELGNASKKRMSELVARKEVCIQFNKHDRYGRIVGKVWVTPPGCPTCGKTLDVGLAQITTGMAWWYRKYAHEQSTEDQGRYEFAEQEAKAKKVGLWRDANPTPPWKYRKGRIEK
jgi:endonuclease YncB( thermonuclease family)